MPPKKDSKDTKAKKETKAKESKEETKATKEADKIEAPAAGAAENKQKNISIKAQYVKDLSFESPKGPLNLAASKERPKIDISVDINAKPIQNELFEVNLIINSTAKHGEETAFICELTYSGIFSLTGITDAEKEPALLIFCPSLLFPFARRIIADSTRDGGFVPLMLDPIDFGRLYAQRKAQAQKQAS